MTQAHGVVGSHADQTSLDNNERTGRGGPTYVPILPPPRRVIATTAGRGGMPGLKSGQRVAGSSNVAGGRLRIVLVGLARMLDRDEQRLVVGREIGPAHLRAGRAAEEQLARCRALRLRSRAPTGRRRGRSCSPNCRRSRSTAGPGRRPRICRACRTSRPGWSRDERRADRATDGIAASHQDLPGETRRRMVAVRRRHLDDVAEPVVGARIGGVDLLGLAARRCW